MPAGTVALCSLLRAPLAGATEMPSETAAAPPPLRRLGLTPLGTIVFPGPVSSNYVVIDPGSGLLFVASGRGGLKLVQVNLPPWN